MMERLERPAGSHRRAVSLVRMLRAPVNIAGQPYVISRALCDPGHLSDGLFIRHSEFGCPGDIVFDFHHLGSPSRQFRKGTAQDRSDAWVHTGIIGTSSAHERSSRTMSPRLILNPPGSTGYPFGNQ